MKENTFNGSRPPGKRLKLDGRNGCLYWENDYGRVYVGHKNMMHTNMIDESLLTLLEDNNDVISLETMQDMRSIHGPSWMSPHSKKGCEFCNGYGVWPDDKNNAPVLFEEINWTYSEPCSNCGSHNHVEYRGSSDPHDPPWVDTKSIGFHAALEKFKRNTKCVESSVIQVQKTPQK